MDSFSDFECVDAFEGLIDDPQRLLIYRRDYDDLAQAIGITTWTYESVNANLKAVSKAFSTFLKERGEKSVFEPSFFIHLLKFVGDCVAEVTDGRWILLNASVQPELAIPWIVSSPTGEDGTKTTRYHELYYLEKMISKYEEPSLEVVVDSSVRYWSKQPW